MSVELKFKNALVLDGSGAEGFLAEVFVDRGLITAVVAAEAARTGVSAEREIDCAGKALSPGFVDMHGHSDYFLIVLPSAESKLKQGITTEVGGNCGYSAAPVRGALAEDRKTSHRELYNLEVDWESFGDYLVRLEAARPAINFAPLVGFNTVRAAAGILGKDPPSLAHLNEMKAMIRESLETGAFGLSMGLIYPPGCFAEIDEIVECAKLAAEAGGFVASHIRSEGDELIEAIEESVNISRRSQARFQVSHLKTSGLSNWGKLARVFDRIEQVRSEGLEITADRYPYLASFTQLSAALPEWVFEGGKEQFLERLADRTARERIKAELARGDRLGDRWERIVISQVFKADLSKYEGRSVAEAAADRGLSPVDFVCWLVHEAQDRASATYHTMSKGNLELILKKHWVMVGSDAAVRTHQGPLAEGKPHPRAYGTMPRVLAWVVKENQWLSLPAAVRKMTSDPCQKLGIKDRGLIKENFCADLVVFDPDRVRDLATYEEPQKYPDGIEMVVVNGKVAVERGELTGVRAGRVLRRSG